MTMVALPDEATRRWTIHSQDGLSSAVIESRANELTVHMPDISDGVPISLDDGNSTLSDQYVTSVYSIPVPEPLACGSSSFKTQAIPVLAHSERWRVFEEITKLGNEAGIRVQMMEGTTLDEPPRHVINLMVMDTRKFFPWFTSMAAEKFARVKALDQLDELARKTMEFQLECLSKALPHMQRPNNWALLKL
jgi:hypothetical protein